LRDMLDSPGRMITTWLERMINGREETCEQIASGLKAVTKDDASAAARKWKLDTVYCLTK
jgi:hypothetical protein